MFGCRVRNSGCVRACRRSSRSASDACALVRELRARSRPRAHGRDRSPIAAGASAGAAINASSSGGHGHSLAEGRTSIQLALKRSSVSAQLGRRSDAMNSHCTNLLGPTHGSSELISRTPRAVRMNAGDGILVGGTREAITRHAWRHWIVASVRRHAPAVTSTPTRVADMLCRGLVRLAGAARRSSRSASRREQRRGAVAVERPHPRC